MLDSLQATLASPDDIKKLRRLIFIVAYNAETTIEEVLRRIPTLLPANSQDK